jgi:hypothetical protein
MNAPPPTSRRPALPIRRLALFALVGFVLACVLQVPLIWAWVILWREDGQQEDSVILARPKGAASNVEHVRVENDGYTGERWVEIRGWTAGLNEPVYRSNPNTVLDDNPFWPFTAADLFPGATDPARWPASIPTTGASATGIFGQMYTIAYASGWPFLSLTGRTDFNPISNGWTRDGVYFVAPSRYLPRTNLLDLPLCYRPLWPQFFANALFYTPFMAGACWALLHGPRAIRRSHRRRRGLCVQCRYDLRGLPAGSPCPECGLKDCYT